jgi:U3 small nucleolar RNA-associated protein 11
MSSGGSTLRNAVKRITHKERSQPAARVKRFGLLEKHKDYVIRAKDYHKKKDYLKILKKKAANRNPDEFYFKMNNSFTSKGVHKEKRDGTLDIATVKLLKTQDAGYINLKKSIDDKKVKKLKDNLHMIGEAKCKKHTIFVDNEKEVKNFNVAKHFDTVPELADRAFNRPRISDLQKHAETNIVNPKLMKKVLKKRERSYKLLEETTKRAEKLDSAMKELILRRNLMGKGSKKKVIITDSNGKRKRKGGDDGDDSGPLVYKWKRERSK